MPLNEIVRHAWLSARPEVAKRYPKRLSDFDQALNTGSYAAMIAEDFQPDESKATEQLLANVAINAVQTLPERELFNLLDGIKLPCCGRYRILWPFCDRRC